MKRILLSLLLLSPLFSFGQAIIQEASRQPELNQYGDPQNNIIDPNGSRQGQWYYQSFEGELLLVETYQDNEKTDAQLLVEMNGIASLIAQAQWISLEGSTLGLSSAALGYAPQADKQVAVICDHNGILRTACLGNWTPADAALVQQNLNAWSASNTVNFDQNYSYALILVQ